MINLHTRCMEMTQFYIVFRHITSTVACGSTTGGNKEGLLMWMVSTCESSEVMMEMFENVSFTP